MTATERKIYEVDGVQVTFVRDHEGARWECSDCGRDCRHALEVAAWMTLQSWSAGGRGGLH